MRVVTYNVLADEVHVRERVPELFRILRESGADIIALQEVSPWFAARLLREEWVAGYQRAMQDGRTLLAREFIILSKFPVIDHAVIALPGPTIPRAVDSPEPIRVSGATREARVHIVRACFASLCAPCLFAVRGPRASSGSSTSMRPSRAGTGACASTGRRI
jgi:hypothetical protein